MTYRVYVHPENEDAKKALVANYRCIDDMFRQIHKQEFFGGDGNYEHGLILSKNTKYGDVTYLFADAHWDDNHLEETKGDIEEVIKNILGSTEGFDITATTNG